MAQPQANAKWAFPKRAGSLGPNSAFLATTQKSKQLDHRGSATIFVFRAMKAPRIYLSHACHIYDMQSKTHETQLRFQVEILHCTTVYIHHKHIKVKSTKQLYIGWSNL